MIGFKWETRGAGPLPPYSAGSLASSLTQWGWRPQMRGSGWGGCSVKGLVLGLPRAKEATSALHEGP